MHNQKVKEIAVRTVDACAAFMVNADTERLKSILKVELNDGIDTMRSSPEDTALLHQTIILVEDLENINSNWEE